MSNTIVAIDPGLPSAGVAVLTDDGERICYTLTTDSSRKDYERAQTLYWQIKKIAEKHTERILCRATGMLDYNMLKSPTVYIEKPAFWTRGGKNTEGVCKMFLAAGALCAAFIDNEIVEIPVKEWKGTGSKLNKTQFAIYYPDWAGIATNKETRDAVGILEWVIRQKRFQNAIRKGNHAESN